MLYFTRWKALAIIVTALAVCLCAVPNFFSEAFRVSGFPDCAKRSARLTTFLSLSLVPIIIGHVLSSVKMCALHRNCKRIDQTLASYAIRRERPVAPVMGAL